MLDMLAGYVKTLAVFIIFASVCQIIMPEGRFKGAISFVTGIMLMLIILRPVNAVLNNDTQSHIKSGINLNAYAADNELEQYGEDSRTAVIARFEKDCADMLENELGAKKVAVSAENSEDGVFISSVTIEISGADTAAVANKVSELCGIEKDKISVINGGFREYNEADS